MVCVPGDEKDGEPSDEPRPQDPGFCFAKGVRLHHIADSQRPVTQGQEVTLDPSFRYGDWVNCLPK